MEESELMKERLQAITEKHRLQEVIRQKKLELDQEKLKLKHLKKKSLREQWLLDSGSSHNAPGSSSEQQTRSLLLTIYRMEKEIEALEREEAIVSKNESFILEQLRVVEKSTQDIIKEAHDTFAPALFAMEINVNRNLRTGESTVLSTSSIHPEDLHPQPGLKVYDDGRKCVYLHSLEGSDDQSSVSELSASEVEQLLKSATVHRQRNGHSCCSYNHHHNHQPHQHSLYNFCLAHHEQDQDVCWRAPHRHGNDHNHNKREIQRGTSFKLPQNNHKCSSKQLRRHQSFHSNGYHSHSNRINNALTSNRANFCPSARYTLASDIPLSDYMSADEDEEEAETAEIKYSPAPWPAFKEDTPYTVLNAIESGEPITAVFMGFQTAQDDSGRGQEFEGVMKAELVVIGEDDDGKAGLGQEKSGKEGGAEERRREGRVGSGIRKLREKHCCTLS